MSDGLKSDHTFVLESESLRTIDVPVLPNTGERQVALNREEIAPDHRKRYEWAASWLLRVIGPGKRVLDAACGIGYGSQMLAEAGFKVTGMDCVADVIKVAEQAYPHENLTYKVGNIEAEALGEYDAVVSFETLEHIPEAPVAIERFRLAAPILLGSVPNENVLKFDRLKWPFHLRHYTPDELTQLLSGYTIENWYTQDDKWVGNVREGNDGRFLIFAARRGTSLPSA